jgi:dTDP-4-amino-4,6-dideoxygalactose transaminase
MIPIAKPSFGQKEIKEVIKILKSGKVSKGVKVDLFEKNFADFIKSNYCIAVNNGTSALHTALLANGIKTGDEVITTPFSFIATSNAILYCNAKPVFVDICEDSFNINSELIEEKITDKTKAILPVHLFGNPADMQIIMNIAKKYKLKVIEDCSHAHAAKFKGQKVGSFGNSGCFSFYPSKNLPSIGGGAVVTNSKKTMNLCRRITNHGFEKKRVYNLGYNYTMNDVEAVVAIEQLKNLELNIIHRIKNANYLTKGLQDIEGIICPKKEKDTTHVFHQYSIRVTKKFKINRDRLLSVLIKKGICARVYYQTPICNHPLYKKSGYKCFLPVAEKISKQILSLPIHPNITKKELDFIIKTIKRV